MKMLFLRIKVIDGKLYFSWLWVGGRCLRRRRRRLSCELDRDRIATFKALTEGWKQRVNIWAPVLQLETEEVDNCSWLPAIWWWEVYWRAADSCLDCLRHTVPLVADERVCKLLVGQNMRSWDRCMSTSWLFIDSQFCHRCLTKHKLRTKTDCYPTSAAPMRRPPSHLSRSTSHIWR